jgi:hypothetical protein
MQLNLIIISVFMYHTASCQSRTGVEEFFYIGHNVPSTVVPRIYFQDYGGWYGEARFNYEEARTFSLYGGKTFSKRNDLSFSVTPVIGLVWGKFKGGSAGVDLEMDYGRLTFCSAVQYTRSGSDRRSDFFYAWSELGCQVTSRFYMGLALQQTCVWRTGLNWDPGLQIGFLINKWTFPLYIFDPAGSNRHFVLGVTREWRKQRPIPLKR